MNLTLNDFRNILGKVNDGDAVFTKDNNGNATGIEKANYGSIRTYNAQVPSVEDNAKMRRLFAQAIANASSQDRPTISGETLKEIRSRLGIEGIGGQQKWDVITTPLARREIKAILDIVDGSCELINVDNETLDSIGSWVDKGKRREFERAVNSSRALSGKSSLKTVVGRTFLGFPRAEIAGCVKKNLALVKALTLDEMTWHFQSSGEEMSVEDALKASLRKMMCAFGEGKTPLTRTRELVLAGRQFTASLPAPVALEDNENNAENFFTEHNLSPESELAALLTDDPDGRTDAFSILVLSRAAGHVKNSFRKDFQDCIALSGNSAQQAQGAYDARTLGTRRALGEFVNDLKSLVSADSANLAKFRADLAKNLVETLRGIDPATLDDCKFRELFMAVLSKTVAPFSMRQMAMAFTVASGHQDFHKADFAYAYIDDFNRRVAALPPDSGFKATIAHAQSQAFLAARIGRPVPELRGALKNGTLESLYNEFKTAREQVDPEVLRAKRQTRNRDAATRVLRALNGDAAVNGWSPARLEREIANVYAKLYVSAHGYYSLRGEDQNEIPKDEANARVGEWIMSASDDEIAFLEKFCSLDLLLNDEKLQHTYFSLTNNKLDSPPLYAALRDGGNVIQDMSKESALAISTFLMIGLNQFERNGGTVTGGKFTCILEVGNKDQTRADCRAFIEKLDQESHKAGGPRHLLTNAQKTAVLSDNNPQMRIYEALGYTGYLNVKGFGTFDALKVIKLLARAGIALGDFSCANQARRTEACVRSLAVMHFAAHNGYNLDSLPEFVQRVTGKDFKEVSFSDFITFSKLADDKKDAVPPGCGDVVNIVTGKVKLSEAKLSQDEVVGLRKALDEIRKPNAKPETVVLKGKTLSLEMLSDGGVRATLKTGDKPGNFKLYRLPQSAVDFSRALDDVIVANAKDYPKGVVKSVLPPLPNAAQGDSLMRAREVYAKTICALAGKGSPVDYASVPTAALRQLAVDAVDGNPIPAPNAAPQTFNSAEMIEMHRNFSAVTLAEVDAKVKFTAGTTRLPEEYRRKVPPSPKEFRAIVADLFLNEDTWAFDAQAGAAAGERIRKLMISYAHELRFVFSDIEGFVKSLPREELPGAGGGKVYLADKVAEILRKLRSIPADSLSPDAQGNIAPATRQALSEAEALVDALVKSYAEAMQEKVTQLFEVQNAGAAEKAVQYQTFAEISGISALNPNTTEGKFALGILKGYFKKSAGVDQRAMLAAMLRNTDGDSSAPKQVAELLKGAGPLLQKMLQGLPISSFNPETQIALKDMKSRLAPIPVEAVKAQLLELVNSSNGEILSIEVKQVLGAATVGEALLCHIKTKDRPLTGEDCVVKVLRPNIYTAVLREKAIFDEIIAQEVPAVKSQFEVRYKGILEEFDLTIESENIRLGRVHYEHPVVDGASKLDISSMDHVENVSPATGTLVVKKAEGVTYDRYVTDIHDEADATVRLVGKPSAIQANGRVTRPCSSVKELIATRRRLEYLKAFLGEKRNHISDFAKAWFENGLYGDGFMHGDLHAGNIMVSDRGATIIDFGNCIRLSASEQNNIRTMLTKASIGYGEDAIKTFKKLLGAEAKSKLEAILADPQKEAFRKNLYGVFTKGTAADVMSRIYAAINLLQREGVEIPGSVTNFFQSFSRLNDIYQTMADEMARIDGLIDTLVLDDAALSQVGDDAPVIVKELKSLIASLSSNPDKEFDFAKFAATANKFIYFEGSEMRDANDIPYGGAENLSLYCRHGAPEMAELHTLLATDRAKFNATVAPLVEWLVPQKIPLDGILYLRDDPRNAPGNELAEHDRECLQHALSVIKDTANIPDGSEDYTSACDEFFASFSSLLQHLAANLPPILDPTPRSEAENKFTGLEGVKASYGKPIFEVCGEVVASKLENFQGIVQQFGTFIWDVFSRRETVSVVIRENMRYAGKLGLRKEFARETLERTNDALDANVKLTTAKRRVLMGRMESFAWPFEGAWAETHVKGPNDAVLKVKCSLPPEKRAVLLEALAVNLGDLKTALGYAEGENLPPEVARLAVTYLVQIDPRAALAVKSLDEVSYNAFLAEIEQREDAALLGAAVAALRNAPGDAQLIAAKPKAAKEFATIDRKADKFDLSLGGLKNMINGDDNEDDV